MSSPTIKDGLEGIATEVLEEVQKEAEMIILQAEKEAKAILKEAKDESNKIYVKRIADDAEKASSETRKIVSRADVDVRNQFLQVKETLMDLVFEKAQSRLVEFVSSDAYHQYLLRIIQEAAQKIGSENLIVQVNSKDKAWLTQGSLKVLSKRIHLDLDLAEEAAPFVGGCKVQTTDGKLVYENTLENRIQQLKPLLRLEVAKILFQKEEPESVG